MNIKKGDTVLIITGKDRKAHKTGKVSRALPKVDKVVVDGCNLVKRHRRETGRTAIQAGITEKPMPIHVSNVKLICPHCNKPTKTYPQEVAGAKVRVCKNCNETVDQPQA